MRFLLLCCCLLVALPARAAVPVAAESCSPGPSPFTLAPGARVAVTGSTVNATDDVSSFCGDLTAAPDAPDLVYALTLAQGGTFTLEVAATSHNFKPAVYVRHACADDDRCFAFGAQKQLIKDDYPAGTYFVVVDGAGGTRGTFTLRAALAPATCGDGVVNPGEDCDEGGAAAGDGCGDPGSPGACKFELPGPDDVCQGSPVSAALGTTIVHGSTLGYSDQYGGSFSLPLGGADRVYAVTPQASGTMTVFLGLGPDGVTDVCAADITAPACWDRVLYARITCDDAATELDASDSGALDVETIQMQVTAGEPVFLFVDGYDGQPYSRGPFDLVIQLAAQ